MNSMKIGTYQMDTTFGLYLPEYTIPAPAVQTNFVKIIGRDGSVDLSNALGLHYDSRTWSLDFKCFDPTVNWHTLSSNVMNAIHGKRLNFEFDDDPNYFWTGRVSVQNYVSNHGTGTLKVTIVSDPFKYAKLATIVTKTASTGTEYTGSLVTFNTANAKINDVSVTMQPIQDLHGYDSPWPAGGGVNKLNAEYTESITLSKTFLFDTPLPAGQYTLSFISADTSSQVASYQLGRYRDETGSYVYTAVNPAQGFATFTNTEPCSKIVLYSNKAYNESNGFTTVFTGLMLKAGGTGTYSPYSNICPISGLTGLNVYRTGKNWYSGGNVTVTNALFTNVAIDPIPAGTYTVSAVIGTAVTVCRVAFRKQNGSALEAVNIPYVSGGRSYATITLPETAYRIYFYYAGSTSGTGNQTYTDVQIELGSTATAYEPYNGNTYALDWTTPAGTVYGGTLDVVTGVLTVTMASVDLGTLTWNMGNSALGHFYAVVTNIAPYKKSNQTMICDSYKFAGMRAYGPWYGENGEFTAYSGSVSTRELYFSDLAYSTKESFQTAMSGVYLCYELETPLTYQLTPQEVAALVGTNNVWSDGGNVTVAVVTPETLTNNGRAVVPTLTASADMVLKWGNYSASVQQGTSTIPQLILENGANLVYIIGTGSISFTWQEASL